MFSNLRQGCQVYVLHKCASTPYVEMGSVESTSNVMMGYYPSMPNMPVNISVRIGDKVTPYQNLPPNSAAADVTNNATGEAVTVVCDKETLNAEIRSMRQKSVDAINSVEYHKQRISAYDALLQQINPEQAERAQRDKDMADMRAEMAQMAHTIAQLTSRLGERLNAPGAENGTASGAEGETSSLKNKKGE